MENIQTTKPIPIAHLLRKRKLTKSTSSTLPPTFSVTQAVTKLDEKIKQLESECEEDNSEKEDLIVEKDRDGNVIRVYSRIQDKEKIQSLPSTLLPAVPPDSNTGHQEKKRRKTQAQPTRNTTIDDIKLAIESYIPNSHVKKPFYCRFCSCQSLNLEEYQQHLQTQSHKEKERFYMKISFCHLCRKQFNSPEQLKEHKVGRAHNERLLQRQSHNSSRKFVRY